MQRQPLWFCILFILLILSEFWFWILCALLFKFLQT